MVEPMTAKALWTSPGGTTLWVEPPDAYLLPARLVKVVENLQRHGLTAEPLPEDSELDVEVCRVDELNRARSFQQHELIGLEVTPRKEKCRIEAGNNFHSDRAALGISGRVSLGATIGRRLGHMELLR
jgi:hypothetical protein